LSKVTTPTLLLSALNDPIVHQEAIPYADIKINPNLLLLTTRCGGHIAWFTGFFHLTRWHQPTSILFFKAMLKAYKDGELILNE
jgi:predicted alpha/beta-fold hydrolase